MHAESERRRQLLLWSLMGVGLGGSGLAWAQQGGRPLKFVVPTSPGSSADTGARAIGEQIQKSTGRTVFVENKVGAGGSLAAMQVVGAEPNGETLAILGNSYLLFPVEYPQMKFDPIRDVEPVAMISKGANVLIVANDSPYKQLQDIVRKSLAEPGKVAYASAGVGSSTFHSGQRVAAAANLDLIHVPYKGSPEVAGEVMAGRVDFAFVPISVALPLVQASRIRALAVSPSKRSALLPNVPTTAEAGVPGSSYESWLAALVPAKTPAAVQAELNKIINASVEAPEVKALFATSGVEPFPMPLAELREFVIQEHQSAMAHEAAAKRR